MRTIWIAILERYYQLKASAQHAARAIGGRLFQLQNEFKDFKGPIFELVWIELAYDSRSLSGNLSQPHLQTTSGDGVRGKDKGAAVPGPPPPQ